jgi:hypothetical protein
MFLMPSQVKKFSQRKLRDKKHQHFSTVSLPTSSVIVDHAVFFVLAFSLCISMSNFFYFVESLSNVLLRLLAY